MTKEVEKVEPEILAWIEHHKGGDNLNWERVDHPYAQATPLIRKYDYDRLLANLKEAREQRDCAYTIVGEQKAELIQKGWALQEAERSRERALEDAAKVCETVYAKDAFHFELGTACAKAIRAMKSQQE